MRVLAMVLMFAAAIAFGQDPSSSPTQSRRNGSISGMVKEESSGAPIPDMAVSVYVRSEGKEVKAFTDAQGHYELKDLPAQRYQLYARDPKRMGPHGDKTVNLHAGQDVSAIDFLFPIYATITGRVLDQNKEPVPGAMVLLMSKEYVTGKIGYFGKNVAIADDQGEYTLSAVAPGFPYLLLAKRTLTYAGNSEAPLDPKLRRPAYIPTYYPNVADPEGAAPIVLRPGEHRENVELRLLRAQSYCVDGALDSLTGATDRRLLIAGQEHNYGMSADGGLAMSPPEAIVGGDGKYRVCDLRPGMYRFMAYFSGPENSATLPQFGAMQMNIVDEDLNKQNLLAGPGLPLSGSVVWEGAPADPAVTAKVSIFLEPLSRLMMGEKEHYVQTSIPSDFSFTNVFVDDYRIHANVNSQGVYVKDILYGITSVLHDALRPGSAVGNGELRVVLAHDGASIAVNVAGDDGNPVPGVNVAILPAEAPSEAALTENMIRGQADQDGNYSYGPFAPGKYLVIATDIPIDHTVERIGKLWAARARAKTVELGPNGKVQVSIEPVKIE